MCPAALNTLSYGTDVAGIESVAVFFQLDQQLVEFLQAGFLLNL